MESSGTCPRAAVGYVPAGSCDLCRVERGRCTVGAMPPTVNVKLNRESNRESFERADVYMVLVVDDDHVTMIYISYNAMSSPSHVYL